MAVSAFDTYRDGKTENVERDRNWHVSHLPFGGYRDAACRIVLVPLGVQKNRIQSIIPRTKCQIPANAPPLDKSMQPVIIKIAKGTSTSGLTSVYESFKKSLKPSLGRVAVSAFNANRNGQSKNMESQCDRHFESPLYKRIPRSNRPSLCWCP